MAQLCLLEVQLEGELNHARVVYCPVYHSETRPCVNVLHLAGATQQVELSVVPGIEELGTEIQSHVFVGKREMLDERKICVHKTRTIDWRPVCIAQFSGC